MAGTVVLAAVALSVLAAPAGANALTVPGVATVDVRLPDASSLATPDVGPATTPPPPTDVAGAVGDVVTTATGVVNQAAGTATGVVDQAAGGATGALGQTPNPSAPAVNAPRVGVQPSPAAAPTRDNAGRAGTGSGADTHATPRDGAQDAPTSAGASPQRATGTTPRGARRTAVKRRAAARHTHRAHTTPSARAQNSSSTASTHNARRRPKPAATSDHRHGAFHSVAQSIDKVIANLPDWSRPIIAVLLALVLVLAARALLTGRRARRLGRAHQALTADVEVLQAALVPGLAGQIGATDISVAYRPADGLASGGDFYDAFALNDDRTAIILGDVSGHDRSAIARASAVRHKLRAYLELGLAPRAVLHAAGEALASDSSDGEFATAVVAIHDGRDGTLTYACAGHPSPILTGRAAHEPVVVSSSAALGWGLPTGRRQTTVVLAEGDRAWFFTDGLIEARADRAFLEREGLERIIGAHDTMGSAADLLAAVNAAASAAPDDLAALAIRSRAQTAPTSRRVEEVEFDAGEVTGKAPARFLSACGASADAIEEIAELADAAVAESGRVVMRVHLDDRGGALHTSLEPSPAQTAAPIS